MKPFIPFLLSNAVQLHAILLNFHDFIAVPQCSEMQPFTISTVFRLLTTCWSKAFVCTYLYIKCHTVVHAGSLGKRRKERGADWKKELADKSIDSSDQL